MHAKRCLVLVVLFSFGCGGSSTSNQGTGGASATGGSSNPPGSGGTPGAGGSAKGGNSGTGGSGVGGVTATGGLSGSGGTSRATGGKAGAGGSPATGGVTSGTGGKATGGAGGTTTGATGGNPGTGGRATGGAGGTTTSGTGGRADAGSGGAAGNTTGATGGRPGTGGRATGGATGQGGTLDGGTVSAGNPYGSCSSGVPARGQPVDTSTPATKIGTGSPDTCDFAQLQAAATKGGIITFDCGASPYTFAVTATLTLPTNKNTVIDGGNKITLDGGGAVQILRFDSPDWQKNTNGLTLQHITLINGKTTPTQAIPTAPAPCSQGWDDGEGGAVYMRDGNLTVIDSIFMNNQAAPLGPDTGGGAIYINGSLNGVLIVGSTFTGNQASNAGAVGCLFAELDVYNSLFQNNQAIGHDNNGDDATKCSVINNGQNETGSGGNGGALYSDGNSMNITLCGDAILKNSAGVNAFGGGLFFTSNNWNTAQGGTLAIADTTMTGNTGGSWTQVQSGSVTNLGTAVGTNAKSITVTNSTIQGYP